MKANITETQINSADAKEIIKVATELKNSPTGLGKIFKGLRKPNIDVQDLQRAWAEEGYPDDTRDLASILKGHGFSEREIKKVFQEVFGETGEDEVGNSSPTIQKIVDYAKEKGLIDDLKKFLQKEYEFQESLDFGKAVVEDVRKIFTIIIHEERTARIHLIKKQDNTIIGRNKK